MIAMMERNSAILSFEHLPDGKATVGFEVCVKHVAAAAQGSECTVHSKLREIVDGRKLHFDVEVEGGRPHDRSGYPPAPGDRRRGAVDLGPAAGRP